MSGKKNGRVPVPGFLDYEVSRDGKVYRVKGRCYVGREIKAHVGHHYGYYKIKLMRDGVRKHLWLHRLVCRAFHGEPPVYEDREAIVRHLDNDPSNNHANNLCWGTKAENEADKQKKYY